MKGLSDYVCPLWMKRTLLAAGIYNLAWGAFVVLFPFALFRWTGMEAPRYPQIWQCVGMIVGVYGIGYLIAASNPLRHWPITLVGLLGKIFGPIGFAWALWTGELPLRFGVTIITNDLVWWVPFSIILFRAFEQATKPQIGSQLSFRDAISTIPSHRGATIEQLSHRGRTLVVFLRHAGCTFCREMLDDLSKKRSALEAQGITLAIVHMSPLMEATTNTAKYDLDTVHRFSDPTCSLYRAFDLRRGTFWQLFRPRVWHRGFFAGLLAGHGIGKLSGDGFQLAGAFVVERGNVIASFRARDAADRLDLETLLNQHAIVPNSPAKLQTS